MDLCLNVIRAIQIFESPKFFCGNSMQKKKKAILRLMTLYEIHKK